MLSIDKDRIELASVMMDALIETPRYDDALWELYWFFEDLSREEVWEYKTSSATLDNILLNAQKLFGGEDYGKGVQEDAKVALLGIYKYGTPDSGRWQLLDYNWHNVFGYGGEPGAYGYDTPAAVVCDKDKVSLAPILRRDVVKTLGIYEGETDDHPWLMAGKLKDGRWFYLEAGCCFTGWD